MLSKVSFTGETLITMLAETFLPFFLRGEGFLIALQLRVNSSQMTVEISLQNKSPVANFTPGHVRIFAFFASSGVMLILPMIIPAVFAVHK